MKEEAIKYSWVVLFLAETDAERCLWCFPCDRNKKGKKNSSVRGSTLAAGRQVLIRYNINGFHS
jgi:hypothetical protein